MIDDQHDNMRSLIAPYSMGALPEEEIRFVRAHILECEECMAEADAFFETASSLSTLIEDVELPQGFADRVLAQVTRPAEAGEFAAKTSIAWRIAASVTIGALAISTLILGVIAFDARRVLERNEDVISALIRSGSGQELRGEQGEIGRLVTTDDGSVLVLSGLRTAPRGKSYELWFIDGSKPVSAGVFDVSGDLAVIESDLEFSGFSGAAVSVEPEGGSPEAGPTGEIVLQG